MMTVALIGLLGFQLYWINNAIRINKERFTQDVHQALNQVVAKLEKQEALFLVNNHFEKNFSDSLIGFTKPPGPPIRIRKIRTLQHKKLHQVSNSDSLKNDAPGKVVIATGNVPLKSADNAFFKEHGKVKNFNITSTDEESFSFSFTSDENGIQSVQVMTNDETRIFGQPEKVLKAVKSTEMVSEVLGDFLRGAKRADIIDPVLIDSLLREELLSKGIDLNFEFGVWEKALDSMIFLIRAHDAKSLMQANMAVNLFPNDIFGNNNYLMISFPDQTKYLLNKIWISLTSSFIFTAIIIFCFTYALMTIVRQKKISEIKNDFINNMTHEFKTPISTVSLACEALQDSSFPKEPQFMNRYLNIIAEENRRLGLQVEKVLQMATLEKKDFDLRQENVDIHQLIRKAIQNTGLQAGKKGGTIHTILKAEDCEVTGDEVHIGNIFHNLLDNAIKYSHEKPQISIITHNNVEGMYITVKDNGIGMSREELHKIFEKFYRIPRGNLHDVKGFGLGLTYVKTMVEAHGGHIKVSSKPKAGSSFTVFLPFNRNLI